jgi:FHS family L-fucose permease-like MFS transporter
MFVAVLMVLLDGKIKLPDIDTAQFWGLATLVLLSSAVGIAAFVIQFIGLNQARKDEWYFNKALYFVVICAVCTVVCMLVVMMGLGWVSLIFLMLNYLFEAMMFPTIFSLSLRRLGPLTKSASSLLMMTPVGGCGFVLMGLLADATGSMTLPFIIPLLGYLVIVLFANQLLKSK